MQRDFDDEYLRVQNEIDNPTWKSPPVKVIGRFVGKFVPAKETDD